jgi:hypothetical protein
LVPAYQAVFPRRIKVPWRSPPRPSRSHQGSSEAAVAHPDLGLDRARRAPPASCPTGRSLTSGAESGLLVVFLAGLMIGRTPAFVGKAVEPRDVKYVAIGTLGARGPKRPKATGPRGTADPSVPLGVCSPRGPHERAPGACEHLPSFRRNEHRGRVRTRRSRISA